MLNVREGTALPNLFYGRPKASLNFLIPPDSYDAVIRNSCYLLIFTNLYKHLCDKIFLSLKNVLTGQLD
jgi:hypothetical protein